MPLAAFFGRPAVPAPRPVTPAAPARPAPVAPAARKPAMGALGRDQLQRVGARSGTKPVAKPGASAAAKPVAPKPPVKAPPAPPPVPVAADAAEAVARALAGEPIRLATRSGEPRGLAIRATGAGAYDVALGGQRLAVAVPADAEPAGVLARVLPMVAELPDPVRATLRRVAIEDPSPETLRYVATVGDAPVTVRRTPGEDDRAVYAIADADGRFELVTPADAEDAWEVAQAFHLWAMVPAALRGALKTVRVEPGANPTDAYWAVQYDRPDFTSAATGGDGVASFWHGTRHLAEDTFLHEFGHVLGQTLSTRGTMWPDGWEAAAAADGKAVSTYATASTAEDFAESFWVYLALRHGSVPRVAEMTFSPAEFAARFPARAALLDRIFAGTFK